MFTSIKQSELLLPDHVAFIMDGNGRWAQKRGLPRTAGHKEGTNALKSLIRDIKALGIKYATFYAFSTENWKRPEQEVNAIMDLLEEYLDEAAAGDNAEKYKLRFIGDRTRLRPAFQEKMQKCEEGSRNCDGLCVCIAINYGGQDEIVKAAKKVAYLTEQGFVTHDTVNNELIESLLYTSDIPMVDLLIRTGGEKRISNFLLWQSAYAELYFCDTLWPDFDKAALMKALKDYSGRNRRFGGIK